MPIEGYIEQLSDRQVRGWACRPDQPDEHVTIEVSNDAGVIASAQASLFRDDLQQAHVGHGDHAFVINFPDILDASRLAAIKVHAVSPTAGKTLLEFLDPSAAPAARRSVTAPAVAQVAVLDQQRPVFIMGAARSGTSALAQGLISTGFYEGDEEGHLFDLAARLIEAVHAHYEANGEEMMRNTLIARVPLRFLNEGIKDQFRAIARFRFRGDRWLDKTPRRAMVLCAPLLREIWPQARFVFMKRRAIENIASRLRKFPQISFADHCREWSQMMYAWREVREALGPAALEIEQLNMARDPAGVVRQLAEHLNLPTPAATRLTGVLAAERPERTIDQFGGVCDIEELDWSAAAKADFGQLCMNEMVEFGYTTGKAYHLRMSTD